MGLVPQTLPVSIVIPAWNRHRVLSLVFPAYLRRNCAEIVVVDGCNRPPAAAGRLRWYPRRLGILLTGRRAHTAANLEYLR